MTEIINILEYDWSKCELAVDLYPMVCTLDEMLNNSRFDEVDDILLNIDLDGCSLLAMTGLIRFTFLFRDDLLQWNDLRDRISVREDVPKDFLRGIPL